MRGGPRQHRFTRRQRLAGHEAFRRVFDAASARRPAAGGPARDGYPLVAGRSASGPFQAVFAVRSGQPGGPMRLGVAVPRKLGPAVVRNRIRRQVREAFRTMPTLHTPGVDVVVLARASKRLTARDVAGHVQALLVHIAARVSGVLPPPPTSRR